MSDEEIVGRIAILTFVAGVSGSLQWYSIAIFAGLWAIIMAIGLTSREISNAVQRAREDNR